MVSKNITQNGTGCLSSKDPLSFLLKYSNDLIILIDTNYKILTLNEVAANYFHWDALKVNGKNFIKCCVDDGIPLCLPKDMDSVYAGEAASCQTIIHHNNTQHTIIWTIEKISTSYTNPEKSEDCILLLGRNVTPQRFFDDNIKPFLQNTLSDLGPMQYYLEQVSQTLPGIIFWKDLEGRYRGCNQYFLDACQFTDMSLIVNHNDFDLWPKEAPFLRDNDLRVTTFDITVKVEEHVSLPNGDILYNTMIKSPLKNSAGKIIGLIGNGIAINEIKKYQNELQYRLESIIDAIPGSVHWKNKDLVYQGCNNFFLKVFNLKKKSDIVGKRDEDIWPKQAHALQQHDLQVIENDATICVEETVTLPSTGETLDLTVVKIPLKDTQGNIIGIVGNSIEITELKNIQAELVGAKRQAEEANQAKTAFLRNMRHDLRTPFSGILGLTQLLKEEETHPGKLEKLNDIITSASALLEMLSEIMEYTQIETNHDRVLMKKFSLKDLIMELSATMAASVKEKGLQFKVNIDSELPDILIGDKFKVQRILVNLLGNAVKFTNTGSITLSALLGETNKNKIHAIFVVKDTGIGIPEEKFNFIFERFGKVSSSYNHSTKGIGLGLHAVKELIDELDGEIDLESQVGHGSTFTCIIPLKKPLLSSKALVNIENKMQTHTTQKSFTAGKLPAPSDTNATPSPAIRPLKILLVEDNKIAKTVAHTLLTKQHHVVTCAECAKEALEKLHENPYDLILLDIGLPDIEGLEVLHKIRHELKLNTPVVVLTAHLDSVKNKSWKKLNANMFLIKPLTTEKLAQINEMMLETNSKQKHILTSSLEREE